MNQNNNMHVPATLTVLLLIGNESAVDPLHCTTVPFSLELALNARVEVMSASQSSPHYNSGVGSGCECSHKLKVFTLYSCNSTAVQPAPNGCNTCELDTSTGWKERLNNPVQKKSLCDSAVVSHHLPSSYRPSPYPHWSSGQQ